MKNSVCPGDSLKNNSFQIDNQLLIDISELVKRGEGNHEPRVLFPHVQNNKVPASARSLWPAYTLGIVYIGVFRPGGKKLLRKEISSSGNKDLLKIKSRGMI